MSTTAVDVICKLVGTAATAVLVVSGWCEKRRGEHDPFTT